MNTENTKQMSKGQKPYIFSNQGNKHVLTLLKQFGKVKKQSYNGNEAIRNSWKNSQDTKKIRFYPKKNHEIRSRRFSRKYWQKLTE